MYKIGKYYLHLADAISMEFKSDVTVSIVYSSGFQTTYYGTEEEIALLRADIVRDVEEVQPLYVKLMKLRYERELAQLAEEVAPLDDQIRTILKSMGRG